MLRRVLALSTVICSVILAGACRSATQIEVHITTDVPCTKVAERHASLFSGDPSTEAPYAVTGACTTALPLNDIGTIVLAPSDDRDVPIDVSFVVGVDARSEDCVTQGYTGCIRARRRVRFVPHDGLRMPVELSLSCLNKVCDPDLTCFRGACVRFDVIAQNGCLGPECTASPAEAPASDASLGDVSVSAVSDAPITDAQANEPELVVSTTGMPRGVAVDGNEVWWSEPVTDGGAYRSAIRSYDMAKKQSGPPQERSDDVFGIALSPTQVAFATKDNLCGGWMNRADGASTLTPCALGSEYIGVGILRPSDFVFAGKTHLSHNALPLSNALGSNYVETEGMTASYATLGKVGLWNLDSGAPAMFPVGTDTTMMRGHAIAPNHWLLSNQAPLPNVYAVAKAAGHATATLPCSGKFELIEDLAWDESSQTLYVAGRTVAQGFGIYKVTNLAPSFPK